MSEPTTEAGKRLVADLPGRYGGAALDPVSADLTHEAILAIEAEAVAADRRRIGSAIRALPMRSDDWFATEFMLERAAILEIIEAS